MATLKHSTDVCVVVNLTPIVGYGLVLEFTIGEAESTASGDPPAGVKEGQIITEWDEPGLESNPNMAYPAS